MAKTARQDDETRLTARVRERTATKDTPEKDPAVRSLRKRLKRIQRKRRRLELRKRHAMGKKTKSETKSETKAETKAETKPEAKKAEAKAPEAKPPEAKTDAPTDV